MADRDYQIRVFDAVRAAFHRADRVVCVLPTGGGKGYKAARIMQMAQQKDRSSIFFAAGRQLIFQLQAQLERMEVPCSVLMAGVSNEYASAEEQALANRCVVASRDTAHVRAFKTGKLTLPPASLVQIDECHSAVSPRYQELLGNYEDSKSLGWTATPCRMDGRPLGEYYDEMVIGPSYLELQKRGFLVPLQVIAPDRPDLKGIKASKDYNRRDLETRMNRDGMVGNVIREWKRHSDGRSTVCFAAGVNHSIHLRNEFRRIGVSAEHIDGTMSSDEQQDILGRATDGLLTVVTNYSVCVQGVDVPRWKYLIDARPTKSFALFRQMHGRIQRPFPGHDHACVARGTLILTDRGEVPIEELQRADLIWDGVDFVSHAGVICQGVRRTMSYQGLTATYDHKVLTEDGWQTIEKANRAGRWLVVGSVGGNAVRVFDDSNPYCEGLGGIAESRSRLRSMRRALVDQLSQLRKACAGGLRVLSKRLERQISRMGLSSSSKTVATLQRSRDHRIRALRRTWNRVSLQGCFQWCVVGCGESWDSGPRQQVVPRSHRQRWALRTGQYSVGNCSDTSAKPRADSEETSERGLASGEGETSGNRLRESLHRFLDGSWLHRRPDPGSLAHESEVWDIVNAGPRNRFCANGVIVANCCQSHSDNTLCFGYADEDVAWELNTDLRAEDLPRTERNKPPHSKKDPYRCANPKCGIEFRGPQCPKCGHRFEKTPEEIKMAEEDLKRLDRAKANKNDSPREKRRYWDKMLGEAMHRGQKIGAAAHRYKDRYGVMPTTQIVPNLPRGREEWNMTARAFYHDVVKPEKEHAKQELQRELEAAQKRLDFGEPPW